MLVMTVMPSAMLGMGRVVAAFAFSGYALALWQAGVFGWLWPR